MKTFRAFAMILLVQTMLAGCSLLPNKECWGPEWAMAGSCRVTAASPNQILPETFEDVDDNTLIRMLKGDGKCSLKKGDEKCPLLEAAFINANSGQDAILLRSQVQDRLFAVSDQRCNLFFTYLRRYSTVSEFGFGALSTILGGVGAIVTGAGAARALAGAAGVSSGLRAENRAAVFQNVLTSVIIPAIQKSREDLKREIRSKRGESRESYTIQGAIADAIQYHGRCHIDVGIQEASASLGATDTGLQAVANAIQTAQFGRSLLQPDTLEPLLAVGISSVKKVENAESTIKELDCPESQTNKEACNAIKKRFEDELTTLKDNAVKVDKEYDEAYNAYRKADQNEQSAKRHVLASAREVLQTFVNAVEARLGKLRVELNALSAQTKKPGEEGSKAEGDGAEEKKIPTE